MPDHFKAKNPHVIPFPGPSVPRPGLMRGWINRVRTWVLMLLRSHLTPASMGWAVAVGVFIGSVPLFGVHILLCVAFARWFKLNQALVYAAAHISNPFFAPFLLGAEVAVGEYIRFGEFRGFKAVDMEMGWFELVRHSGDLVLSCFLGSIPVALVLSAVFGWSTWRFAARWAARREASQGVVGVPVTRSSDVG